MPLPLIPALLWGGVALATSYGVKKGYDAYCDKEETKEYGGKARERLDRAVSER